MHRQDFLGNLFFQHWVGEAFAYWCQDPEKMFKVISLGQAETHHKYVWNTCSQDGIERPWWSLEKVPPCETVASPG